MQVLNKTVNRNRTAFVELQYEVKIGRMIHSFQWVLCSYTSHRIV